MRPTADENDSGMVLLAEESKESLIRNLSDVRAI